MNLPSGLLRPSSTFSPSTSRFPPFTPRASRGSAFTLIELMVAATLTTLLLLGMTGIFDQSMKAWRISSRRADAEREVRAALSLIERDLAGLVVNSNLPISYNLSRLGNQINVGAGGFQVQVANHPPKTGPQGQDWSNASVVLFFASAMAPSPDGRILGDLAGVGYFITWDPNSNQGRGAWNLYRRFQKPEDLLQGRLQRTATPVPNNAPYFTNSLPEPELVAANVFNFWAQLVDITATGSPSNIVSWNSLQNGTNVITRPKYVQLELTAYGNDQARGFTNRAAWIDTNNIAKYGRTFIWRVNL